MTFLPFVVEYQRICKDIGETKHRHIAISERGRWKPSAKTLQAISFVARDDRDGRSRYRAAKMSAFFAGELGWYRDSTSPLCPGAAFFVSELKIDN